MFFQTANTPWQYVDIGIDRQIVAYDNHLMMVNLRFKKDATGYLHQHSHSQISYIAKGTFEVIIADKKCILSAGDSFLVPSNSMHGVICLEDGLLIDVFSPKREDFLK